MKAIVVVISLCWAFYASAGDKDQALTIVADAAKSCIVDITVPSADDNCKQADGKRGDCEGQRNCVCSKPDKHIEWQSADIKNYTVYFYNDNSPFKSNCKLDSNNQGKLKCKINADASGSYDYGVKVAGCADYDPRIIIK